MSSYTALLDANVLYPAPLRDLLMQLAITESVQSQMDNGHSSRMDRGSAA